MLNPTCQCQSLDPADKLNNINPSSTTTSTVTQMTALPNVTAIHPDPSTTPLLYHQSPPKPQNTQQNLGKVPTMPVWTIRNDHVLCTDTVQSNLLPPLECTTKPIFSTSPPSLMPCQLMQRLWKELTITQTLLDRLSNMILIEATSDQQSVPKHLFELLTDLPQTNVTALGLLADISSNFENLRNTTCTGTCKYHLHAISTGAYQNPRNASQHITHYISRLFYSPFYNSPLRTQKTSSKSHNWPRSMPAVTRSRSY